MNKFYILGIILSLSIVKTAFTYEIFSEDGLEKDERNNVYRIEKISMDAQKISLYTGFNVGTINYGYWQVLFKSGPVQKGIPIFNLGTSEVKAHPFSLEVEYELAAKFFHAQEKPYFNFEILNFGNVIFSKPISLKEIGYVNEQGYPERFEKISFKISNQFEAYAMMPTINMNHIFEKYFYIKSVNYKVIKYKN
ncbi:hypothetical protein [Fluviispira multicolorata]|uniref:Uncharacterized protein n=1 Tax=Fluviispira multicolorata TaxID=2654512 RepID=A0A833N3A1_9BACT|nr:hypothetical protein [Fluviispira multicolorata]KAB8033653.1 hypothetical protein GCL57_02795 [Fluviispira multicolorata]